MKKLTGKVIANKMDKSITVLVEHIWIHPLYKKRVRRSKKYCVHSEEKLNVGDKVTIGECRPISKRKKYRVLKKI